MCSAVCRPFCSHQIPLLLLKPSRTAISRDDLECIVDARSDAPHRLLGPHPSGDGEVAVRVFLPHAQRVSVEVAKPASATFEMERIHDDGVFEATIPAGEDLDYRLVAVDGTQTQRRLRDPYAFTKPWFTRDDDDLFVSGGHQRLFEKLGARSISQGNTQGVAFAVWAPHAQRVSVVGTFNRWDGRCHPMRRLTASGVWDLFVPEVRAGDLYKFEIRTRHGAVFLKPDPFAFLTEAAPKTASIVRGEDQAYRFADARWVGDRARRAEELGIAIGSIDPGQLLATTGPGGPPTSLKELSTERFLASVAERGFSVVELVPSDSGGWGSSSGFAPGEFCGAPEDLAGFIDACHQLGVGVIVPAFESRMPAALADLKCFDGEPLYETANAEISGRPRFAIDRGEVRSFLLSNAVFWLDRYHADGLRTDRYLANLYATLVDADREAWAGVRVVVRQPAAEKALTRTEVDRLLTGHHDDPHALLGPHHDAATRTLTLRARVPDSEQVWAHFAARPAIVYELQRIHSGGLFEALLHDLPPEGAYRLGVRESNGRARIFRDPYAFTESALSDFDLHLFGAGNHYRISEKLGAHPRSANKIPGVGFALWAPNADGVSVVGPFNGWDGRWHPMRRHGLSGVWEVFIPELREGELYKYQIRARNGETYLKPDPYAFFAEVPPATASIVYRMEGAHRWGDEAWMARRRATRHWEQPIAIYEVHLGSWMRGEGNRPLSYAELADRLIPHVKELGFTHVELLPVAEHPYEPSWGYQVTGYYAPTSRHGRPEGLMQFVDLCHQQGIGVVLDWVAGHFPKDAHGLARFDGTCLYEHADPRKGEHRDWGTLIFNYGRHEVENFLIANARFWLEHYHVDGLRVDAVASMLYLDYSRPNPGDWIPNAYGGRENLEAIEFLKHMNVVLHAEFPGVMMIAEESTAWPNVSRPVDIGGLGFGYKWNMGWMHDVLAYTSTPAEYRRDQHGKLTFGLVYAFAENYVLALSHDEVVHMKRSLLGKMPGDEWERFANLRLLYCFMYGHPGKKLLFMGAEFGQASEWDHARGLAWELLEQEPHRRMRDFLKDMNRLYRAEAAFFQADFKGVGFEWLEVDNAEESIIAFLRKAKDPRHALLFAMNFSAVSRPAHRIGVPFPCSYTRIFTTNAGAYSGLGESAAALTVAAEEIPAHGREFSICVRLPALSAAIFKPEAPDCRSNAFAALGGCAQEEPAAGPAPGHDESERSPSQAEMALAEDGSRVCLCRRCGNPSRPGLHAQAYLCRACGGFNSVG